MESPATETGAHPAVRLEQWIRCVAHNLTKKAPYQRQDVESEMRLSMCERPDISEALLRDVALRKAKSYLKARKSSYWADSMTDPRYVGYMERMDSVEADSEDDHITQIFIHKLMESLSDHDRGILYRWFFLRMSAKDEAEKCGIKKSYVYTRRYRLMRKLKQQYAEGGK